MTQRNNPMRLWLTTLLVALGAAGAVRADDLLIPKGTVIPVALAQDVSSTTNKVGDKIKAVYIGDEDSGFPTGTVFVGQIVQASAKTAQQSGTVKITFTEVDIPGKKPIAINGVPVSSKGAPPASEQPKKKRGHPLAAVGLGALGGTAIAGNNTAGAILGGMTGAAVSASRTEKANAPKDISVKKGTAFGIQLQQSAKIPQSAAAPK